MVIDASIRQFIILSAANSVLTGLIQYHIARQYGERILKNAVLRQLIIYRPQTVSDQPHSILRKLA